MHAFVSNKRQMRRNPETSCGEKMPIIGFNHDAIQFSCATLAPFDTARRLDKLTARQQTSSRRMPSEF
jgi:hypothetical protein